MQVGGKVEALAEEIGVQAGAEVEALAGEVGAQAGEAGNLVWLPGEVARELQEKATKSQQMEPLAGLASVSAGPYLQCWGAEQKQKDLPHCCLAYMGCLSSQQQEEGSLGSRRW